MKNLSRARGMMYGLAVGDALGTTLEFDERRGLDNLHGDITGGGPFDLNPGEWTDDTSMALALGASLLACGGKLDEYHVMQEWACWYKMGRHSVNGKCFDIGNATKASLDAFLKNSQKLPEISHVALGNGSIMRLAPVVIVAKDRIQACELARRQSGLTHGPAAGEIAATMAGILFDGTKDSIAEHFTHKNRPRNLVSSSGFVVDTWEAALWAVDNTSTFEEALIAAVNLGNDADSVGAVAGQLAGAIYGYEAIPHRWMKEQAWRGEIGKMIEGLMNVS